MCSDGLRGRLPVARAVLSLAAVFLALLSTVKADLSSTAFDSTEVGCFADTQTGYVVKVTFVALASTNLAIDLLAAVITILCAVKGTKYWLIVIESKSGCSIMIKSIATIDLQLIKLKTTV